MQKQETTRKTDKQTQKGSGTEHGVCDLENKEVQVTEQSHSIMFHILIEQVLTNQRSLLAGALSPLAGLPVDNRSQRHC